MIIGIVLAHGIETDVDGNLWCNIVCQVRCQVVWTAKEG